MPEIRLYLPLQNGTAALIGQHKAPPAADGTCGFHPIRSSQSFPEKAPIISRIRPLLESIRRFRTPPQLICRSNTFAASTCRSPITETHTVKYITPASMGACRMYLCTSRHGSLPEGSCCSPNCNQHKIIRQFDNNIM